MDLADAQTVMAQLIGLALFRDRPLWQVVQQLDLSLNGQALPAPSASVQARQRLGEEPLAELFGLLTQAWSRCAANAQPALRVLAVDGVVWSAPDTPDSASASTRPAMQSSTC